MEGKSMAELQKPTIFDGGITISRDVEMIPAEDDEAYEEVDPTAERRAVERSKARDAGYVACAESMKEAARKVIAAAIAEGEQYAREMGFSGPNIASQVGWELNQLKKTELIEPLRDDQLRHDPAKLGNYHHMQPMEAVIAELGGPDMAAQRLANRGIDRWSFSRDIAGKCRPISEEDVDGVLRLMLYDDDLPADPAWRKGVLLTALNYILNRLAHDRGWDEGIKYELADEHLSVLREWRAREK
jgi:hypothetical protein